MEQGSAKKTGFSDRNAAILVADDDEDLLMLMEMKLKAEGFKVHISPNGENIFDIVKVDAPDIVLLDITMRGIDGGTICRQLKSNDETKHIPILLFSANHNIAEITKHCGADGYITKPFNDTEVKEKLVAILKEIT